MSQSGSNRSLTTLRFSPKVKKQSFQQQPHSSSSSLGISLNNVVNPQTGSYVGGGTPLSGSMGTTLSPPCSPTSQASLSSSSSGPLSLPSSPKSPQSGLLENEPGLFFSSSSSPSFPLIPWSL